MRYQPCIYLFIYLFAVCVAVFQTLALCFSAAAPRQFPSIWRAAAVQLLSWESIKSTAPFRMRVNMAAWTPHVPTITEKPHRRQKSQQNCSEGCTQFCFSPCCSSVWFNRMFFLTQWRVKQHLKDSLGQGISSYLLTSVELKLYIWAARRRLGVSFSNVGL